MVGSRALTALAGLLVSVAVSVVAWYYFDTLLVFLFLPFAPLLFRGLTGGGDGEQDGRPPARECPACGFTARSPEVRFCPRDGTELREA